MATDAARLAVRGAISGVAAWAVILGARKLGLQNDTILPGLQIGAPSIAPGLVFGLILGAHLAARGRLAGARVVGYWLASGIAYYVAYHVAYHIVANEWLGNGLAAFAAGGVIAGLCGSALLALLAMPLLRVDAGSLRLSIVVGALAGALLPIFSMEGLELLPGFLAFLVLWQAAYAASLASVMRRR